MPDAAETDVKSAGAAIAAALSGAVTDISDAYGELTLTVETERWVEVARYLRDDPGQLYICFIDLCAVDYPVRAQVIRSSVAATKKPLSESWWLTSRKYGSLAPTGLPVFGSMMPFAGGEVTGARVSINPIRAPLSAIRR